MDRHMDSGYIAPPSCSPEIQTQFSSGSSFSKTAAAPQQPILDSVIKCDKAGLFGCYENLTMPQLRELFISCLSLFHMWLRDGMSITESIATFALFHDPDLKWAAKEGPLKFFFIPFLRSCVRVRQIVYEANIFDEEDVHRCYGQDLPDKILRTVRDCLGVDISPVNDSDTKKKEASSSSSSTSGKDREEEDTSNAHSESSKKYESTAEADVWELIKFINQYAEMLDDFCVLYNVHDDAGISSSTSSSSSSSELNSSSKKEGEQAVSSSENESAKSTVNKRRTSSVEFIAQYSPFLEVFQKKFKSWVEEEEAFRRTTSCNEESQEVEKSKSRFSPVAFHQGKMPQGEEETTSESKTPSSTLSVTTWFLSTALTRRDCSHAPPRKSRFPPDHLENMKTGVLVHLETWLRILNTYPAICHLSAPQGTVVSLVEDLERALFLSSGSSSSTASSSQGRAQECFIIDVGVRSVAFQLATCEIKNFTEKNLKNWYTAENLGRPINDNTKKSSSDTGSSNNDATTANYNKFTVNDALMVKLNQTLIENWFLPKDLSQQFDQEGRTVEFADGQKHDLNYKWTFFTKEFVRIWDSCLRIVHQNPARRHRRTPHLYQNMTQLMDIAITFDGFIVGIYGSNRRCYEQAVYSFVLDFVLSWVIGGQLVGFLLDIYEPSEFLMVFWHLDVLYHLRTKNVDNVLFFNSQQRDREAKMLSSSGKKKKNSSGRDKIAEAPKMAEPRALRMLGERYTVQGLLRATLYLIHRKLLPVEKKFSNALSQFRYRYENLHAYLHLPKHASFEEFLHVRNSAVFDDPLCFEDPLGDIPAPPGPLGGGADGGKLPQQKEEGKNSADKNIEESSENSDKFESCCNSATDSGSSCAKGTLEVIPERGLPKALDSSSFARKVVDKNPKGEPLFPNVTDQDHDMHGSSLQKKSGEDKVTPGEKEVLCASSNKGSNSEEETERMTARAQDASVMLLRLEALLKDPFERVKMFLDDAGKLWPGFLNSPSHDFSDFRKFALNEDADVRRVNINNHANLYRLVLHGKRAPLKEGAQYEKVDLCDAGFKVKLEMKHSLKFPSFSIATTSSS